MDKKTNRNRKKNVPKRELTMVVKSFGFIFPLNNFK